MRGDVAVLGVQRHDHLAIGLIAIVQGDIEVLHPAQVGVGDGEDLHGVVSAIAAQVFVNGLYRILKSRVIAGHEGHP